VKAITPINNFKHTVYNMSRVSVKKLKQRCRQQEAARRSLRTPGQAVPRSILRRAGELRSNNRSVVFSATCTARPFDKTMEPHWVTHTFPEEVQAVVVMAVVEEVQFLQREEEEEVQFDDAGHVPADPIVPRKRALQRELAALRSDLGVYWGKTSSRLRRSRRVSKAPERFIPTF
jgi:ribulose kinase